ncbi:MAG: exosortase/archaeosortase family protein [Roseimicrobium sp.]
MSTALADTPSTALARQATWQKYIIFGSAAAFLVFLFAVWPYQHWTFEERGSVLEGWHKVLMDKANAEWQFCLIVPLLVGWLAYRQRTQLVRLPIAGTWWGVPFLVVATFCYWMGYKVDTGYLGYAAIQISLAGIILLLGGVAWLRALFLPWLFLVFAWPFFPLENLLAAKLKIPTAEIAAKLLPFLGIDVIRDGSTIRSAADPQAMIGLGSRFALDVAESCSGMRSLYALIMTGVLYSIIGLKRTVPRVILSISTIPLAVAGNVVRLIMLAVASVLFGQEFAVGKMVGEHEEASAFHMLAGFIVFGVALAGMFALASLLEGVPWRKAKGNTVFGGGNGLRATPDTWIHSAIKSGLLLGFGALSLLLCSATPTTPNYATAGLRLELPSVVGPYSGTEHGMSAKEAQVFDIGVKLDRRTYAGPGLRPITATVVLSGLVKKTLHTPEVCMPNQGWRVTSNQVIPIPLPDGRTIDVSLMQAVREFEIEPGSTVRRKALHLYWYHGSRGVTTPSYFMHNVISYRDAIFRNLNHRWTQASLFMIASETRLDALTSPLDDLAAMDEITQFASQLIPQLMVKD